jgi:hypothetical protein
MIGPPRWAQQELSLRAAARDEISFAGEQASWDRHPERVGRRRCELRDPAARGRTQDKPWRDKPWRRLPTPRSFSPPGRPHHRGDPTQDKPLGHSAHRGDPTQDKP